MNCIDCKKEFEAWVSHGKYLINDCCPHCEIHRSWVRDEQKEKEKRRQRARKKYPPGSTKPYELQKRDFMIDHPAWLRLKELGADVHSGTIINADINK